MSERKKLGLRADEGPADGDPRKSWGVTPARLERLREHARQLRRNPTEPELALWERLQGQKLGGFKFQRQRVIGSTIADFACEARWLVVEVDGDAHDTPAIDASRDRKLIEVGIRVLRFASEQVMQDLDAVCEAILAELNKPFDRRQAARQAALPHPPAPSPETQASEAQPEGEDEVELKNPLGDSLEGSEG
jgi:very-short-patch-repair endonuclease